MAQFLLQNRSIEEVSLDGNHMGMFAVSALSPGLSANKSLKRLYLFNNEINGKSCLMTLANAIVSNAYLEELSLSNNRIDDVSIVSFATILTSEVSKCNLRHLYLSSNRIGNMGAIQIFKLLSLETINLSRNTNIDDNAISLICENYNPNSNWKQICLERCTLTDKSALLFLEILISNYSIQNLLISGFAFLNFINNKKQ